MSMIDDMDQEANLFAMCLLMPENLVRKWFDVEYPKGLDLTDDGVVKRFAKAFAVPEVAACVRLMDLKIISDSPMHSRRKP